MCTALLIRQAGRFACDPSAARTVIRIAPANVASVPGLRRFARETARAWGLAADAVDSLCLIVSELVTNACQHSGSSQVALLLLADPHRVAARVADTGRWKSATGLPAGEEATSGRGLEIVRACAADLEIQQGPLGTNITATLAAGCALAGDESSPMSASLVTAGYHN